MPDRRFPPMLRVPSPSRLGILLVVAAVGLAADQASKSWAFAPACAGAALHEVVPGLFAGARGRNFGFMYRADGVAGHPASGPTLALLGLVLLAVALWRVLPDRARWRRVEAVAAGLVVAGALGNTADRLMRGFVRDFLVLALRPHDIFNLADVLMLVGTASLTLSWATRRIAAAGRVRRTSRQESGWDAPPAQVLSDPIFVLGDGERVP